MLPLRPRILCTEDDGDTREMITIILTNDGFEVTCAESPNEAIELAMSRPYDLILVDNWMPGLSGTVLTETIRQFDRKTPILFYSGAAYDKDKEAARMAGAQGYLVKPTSCDELTAEVTRIIAESKIAHPIALAMTASSI
jgi:DNA-binding response OmpR family regulator